MAAAQRRRALGALLAALALAGCGGGDEVPAACLDEPEPETVAADEAAAGVASVRLSDLGSGWKAIRPEHRLDFIRPPLGTLVETGRTSSPIFARRGTVVRSSTTLFQAEIVPIDLELYAECLAGAFATQHVRASREAGAAHVELTVPRPTGTGSDTVSVYALVRGRGIVVLEFVHGGDLDRRFARRVLERVASRLRTAGG